MKLDMNYGVSFKTIIFSITLFALWIINFLFYFQGSSSFFIAFCVNVLIGYLAFTPLHEAVHGNIAGKDNSFQIFQDVLGLLMAMILFSPYKMFKILHLRHHSFTNVKEKDPDFWVATSNPFMLAIKCFSIIPHYYYHAFFKATGPMKSQYISTVLSLSFYILTIWFFNFQGYGFDLAYLWFGGTVFSLAILAFTFDWLPHHPHKETGRFTNSIIIDRKIIDLLTCYQSYHLIHHMYPRIPFYEYPSTFRKIKKELIENNSQII